MKAEVFPNRSQRLPEDQGFCNGSVPTQTVSYVLCAFVGSFSVLITCGNLLVIVSVMYFKQLHTPTNCLILSLAVADLLVGVFVLPFSTLLSVGSCWRLRGLLCKVRNTFDVFLCASSILNLCFISVDRYYAVCHPLTYRSRMTAWVTAAMVLAAWAASALLGVGITLRGPAPPGPDAECKIFQAQNSAVMGAIFAFYIPASVILMLYIKVFTVAHRQAKRIADGAKPRAAAGRVESKATKTLAVVVGVFLASWSPFFLCMSFYPLSGGTVPVRMIEAFKWFGWSNSMLNPIVYAFFYKWFRSAFKLIVYLKIFRGDFSNSKLA